MRPIKSAQKSYYGRVMLLKKKCPRCGFVSFVIDGKCSDCGLDQELRSLTRIRKRRESTTDMARRKPPKEIQEAILEHQMNRCVYCGNRFGKGVSLEWDHFIPLCSGESSDKNWIAACRKCNGLKSSMLFSTMEEAQIYIRNKRDEIGLRNNDYFGGSYDVCKL
jgi:5-methylcytosine-specific restriction endonuclease McrA